MNESGREEEKVQSGPGRVLSREVFLHFLDLEIKRARRYQNFISLLLLGLRPLSDEFMNNLSGYSARLKEVLTEEMRETDLIGLIGRDKMVALLPYANECSGRKAKGRIERTLKFCDFEKGGCEVSIRAICFPANITNTTDLLRFLQQPEV